MKKIILAIVFSICVVSMVGCGKSNGNGIFTSFPDNVIDVVKSEDGNTIVYNRKGKVLKKLGTEEKISDEYYNTKQNVVVLTVEKGAYVIGGDKVKKIDIDMRDLVISDNGKTIFYETYEDNGISIGTYDVSSGKSKKISTIESSSGSVSGLRISPNGDTFAYLLYRNNEIREGFVSIDGKKPVSMGDNTEPIAISNDGKLVYYEDDSSILYVKKGDKATKLASTSSYEFVLNQDYSQAIIYDEGMFISVNGEEPIELAHYTESYVEASVLVPDGTINNMLDDYADFGVYGVDSFSGKYVVVDEKISETLYYIDKDFTANEVMSGGREYSIANSNEVLVSDGNSIYKVVKEKCDELFELECSSIYVTDSVSNFYCIIDGDLYYKKGDKEPKLIEEDIDTSNYVIIKNAIYYMYGDEEGNSNIYYSKNGEAGKKVKNGEKVTRIRLLEVYTPFTYFINDDSNELYIITADDELKLILENY